MKITRPLPSLRPGRKKTRRDGSRSAARSSLLVERVQTGVRLEKRLLKVLKGLAEFHDLTLGDLLEGIVLHAFEGKPPFGPESRERIADLKRIYGLDLGAEASHRLMERP
jgi:hypothetical protein